MINANFGWMLQYILGNLFLSPLCFTTLSDIGCQSMAVGGRQLFSQSVVEKAPRAVRLVGAGRTPIPRGDKGVTVTMDIPIMGKRGPVLFRCHNVFIYLADIGNRSFGIPVLFTIRCGFYTICRAVSTSRRLLVFPRRSQETLCQMSIH